MDFYRYRLPVFAHSHVRPLIEQRLVNCPVKRDGRQENLPAVKRVAMEWSSVSFEDDAPLTFRLVLANRVLGDVLLRHLNGVGGLAGWCNGLVW